ncbi:MAG: HDOD domain-containing protein [Nitrosomonas sp.]|nr:HDOD domain-containing protein [Nitrosomonas sp.]
MIAASDNEISPIAIDFKNIKTTQPDIIARIIEIDESSPNCFREMDCLLRADQAVASFILRVANSPIYNRSQPIRTLPIATSLLGINIIRSLVILAFSRSVFSNSKNTLVCKHIWHHSLLTAIASHRLCLDLGETAQCEEAFVAGLVHDIGKVLLFSHARKEYMQALSYALEQDCPSVDAEQFFLGTDHRQIGLQAVHEWRLPIQFSQYVGTNLDQLSDQQAENKVLLSLAVANAYIKGMGIGANPLPPEVLKENLSAYGLAEAFIDSMLEATYLQTLMDNEIFQYCAHDQH